MSKRTVITDPVREKKTALLVAYLIDEDNAAINGTLLDTLKLTLYAKGSGTIINNRSAQDVLNANNVTVDSSGKISFQLQGSDNVLLDITKSYESHIALFEWSWSAGTKSGAHEIEFKVENLLKIT